MLFSVQLGTLIALVIYVVKTWQMASATAAAAKASAESASEMKLSREAASAPRVSLYFRTLDAYLAYIVLENRGESTAEDVRMTFQPALQSSLGASSLSFFDTPKVLPPRTEIAHGFDVWHQYFGQNLPLRYTVEVSYKRADNQSLVTETHVLDAGGTKSLISFSRKSIHDVAKSLEKTNALLEKVGKNISDRTSTEAERYALAGDPGDLLSHISRVESLWSLFQHHTSAPGVYPDHSAFIAELHRQVIAAATEAHKLNRLDIEEVLHDLDAALSDRAFHYLGDQSEAHSAVSQAIGKVRGALGTVQPVPSAVGL